MCAIAHSERERMSISENEGAVDWTFLGDESNDLTDNAVWLGKKSRLSGPVLRVAKVAQADANQAKPLVRSEADTL